MIVFTSQPLNWIVAIIMFTHVGGVFWLISNPENYYSVLNANSSDIDSLEISLSDDCYWIWGFCLLVKTVIFRLIFYPFNKLEVSHLPPPAFCISL